MKEFSKFLRGNKEKDSVFLMNVWLQKKLKIPSNEKVSKIIRQELYLAKNKNGSFIIIAQNENGRILMKSLYNFALSYENYKNSKKLHSQQNSLNSFKTE